MHFCWFLRFMNRPAGRVGSGRNWGMDVIIVNTFQQLLIVKQHVGRTALSSGCLPSVKFQQTRRNLLRRATGGGGIPQTRVDLFKAQFIAVRDWDNSERNWTAVAQTTTTTVLRHFSTSSAVDVKACGRLAGYPRGTCVPSHLVKSSCGRSRIFVATAHATLHARICCY